jgi:hypothetical protein
MFQMSGAPPGRQKSLCRNAGRDADNLNQNATSKIVGKYALVTRRFFPVV